MASGSTVATASYGVAGEMKVLSYFGYNETRTYNAMLQLTQQTVPGMMDMQYLYTTGANNGRITNSIDGVAGETVDYTYDAVNRLAEARATNGSWGQTFTYDGFGNLMGKTVTAGSPPAMSATFDPLTNRPNGGSYDKNGNSLGLYLAYDVENRQIQGGVYGAPESYVYDPSGKRVKKWKQDAEGMFQEEYYFYGLGGQKLVTLTCQQGDLGMLCDPPKYNVYFGGKLMVSKGMAVVTDRLGSGRANSAGERMTYYPYGEERTSTADGREKFGTYTRDNPTQDYADQRYYAVGQGRFNTPDPSTGVNPANPATWNKYAYVVGDPVNFGDRRGLFYSQAGGGGDDDDDGPVDEAGGRGGPSDDLQTVNSGESEQKGSGGGAPDPWALLADAVKRAKELKKRYRATNAKSCLGIRRRERTVSILHPC